MLDQPIHNMEETADEISIKVLVGKFKDASKYIKKKWQIILLFSILGGSIGLAYSNYKKPLYIATCTFVLAEEGKSGGLGQYSGLAALAGIDVGGSGGGGIFQGDNILELYKSRLMIEKTLLTSVEIDGRKQLLIDRYIGFNKLLDKWKEKDGINDISFNSAPSTFNRKQDSIITDIVNRFNKNVLNVSKLDKKLSIIKVDVNSTDEVFAKLFNTKLVETVNEFYTYTKTKKSVQNVKILQHQADSVKRVLGYSISGVASAIDAAPNANPALVSLRVPSQKRQIDVQASSAIYSEIVKNLEVSKISLRQETPLIQVIDQPVLPLTVTKIGHIKGLLIGFLVGCFVTIGFLLFVKVAKKILL
jgi:hypothetical protein